LQEEGRAHPFCSSHEEKTSLVEASHRGQPWLSSSNINDNMVSLRERKGREGEKSTGAQATLQHGEEEGVHGGEAA
jgi:hypothetical protein